MQRWFLCSGRYSSALIRWVIASSWQQDLDPSHLTFLADKTGSDIDTTDSEQLLLPRLRHLLVICNRLACTQEFTAYRDVILTASQSNVLQMNVSEYGRSPVSLSRHVSSLRRISDILNLPKYVCCLVDPRITTPADDTASSTVANDQVQSVPIWCNDLCHLCLALPSPSCACCLCRLSSGVMSR